MYTIINDRIFWIYFIVTLFFIILGMGAILTSNDPYMIIISILWLLSNVALMILVYHASVRWGPSDPNDITTQICVVDANSRCFDPDNRVWLFVNILFIALLIVSLLWAGELGNKDAGPLRTMSGILILLGGLLFCGLASGREFMYNIYITPFWVSVGYLLIWFGLTLYVVITPL
jgi:hypothetical protein